MMRLTRSAVARSGVPVAVAAVLLVMALVAAGCGSSTPASQGGTPTATPTPSITPKVVPSVSASTIVEAAKAGDLQGFAAAVAAAGLDSALKQNIPYTVLAPNNDAFSQLGLEQLIKDLPRLKAVMDYHVIPAENLKIGEIKNGQEAATNLGYPVVFTVKDGAVVVNDANVVQVIEGPTWSIFVIDKVLSPPDGATPSAVESPSP